MLLRNSILRATLNTQKQPSTFQSYSKLIRMASTSTSAPPPEGSQKRHFPDDASLPGQAFEPRQTMPSDDAHPDHSKSFPLSPARRALIDDILALYGMEPTIERIKRYTPACVYNDQFVHATDRYKMAAQWVGLVKLFAGSKNEGWQVVTNDRDLIQFRNEQTWTFKGIHKSTTINAIVSLSLDPATIDSDFIRVAYHKDQADSKDYDNKGFGAVFKKTQTDLVPKILGDDPMVKAFEEDKDAGSDYVPKYKDMHDAPQKDL